MKTQIFEKAIRNFFVQFYERFRIRHCPTKVDNKITEI
jgi:hypothetical protein